MAKARVIIFFITLIIVGSFGTIALLYAQGYRFDPKTVKFSPNGLLVANSNPNGAQIFVDGDLKTATNATISLPPGTYDVVVKKESYLPWQKRLVIEKEIVTQINVELFPSVPSLSAITFLGAFSPLLSPDLTKVVYGVPDSSEGKGGLWVIEIVDLPLGFRREPHQVTDGELSNANWEWSPDSREILLSDKSATYLLDSGAFTPQNKRVNVTSTVKIIEEKWNELRERKLAAQLTKLPDELESIFNRKAKDIQFSPDENKILYKASGTVNLPSGLIKPLPGASTQKQVRDLVTDKTYVLDIKEDRNFEVDGTKDIIHWLPTSNHLLISGKDKITVIDYDGTNPQTIFSGPYEAPYAIPFSNGSRLLILTNLGANDNPPNLYSLSLK